MCDHEGYVSFSTLSVHSRNDHTSTQLLVSSVTRQLFQKSLAERNQKRHRYASQMPEKKRLQREWSMIKACTMKSACRARAARVGIMMKRTPMPMMLFVLQGLPESRV
jgi:hypothetical protein